MSDTTAPNATMPAADSIVDIFFTFPSRVLAEDSDRYFRRTLLGDICEIGVPEVIGYCVRMAFRRSTLEDQDKARSICDRIAAEIRRHAQEDPKLFPDIERSAVKSLPCQLLGHLPQFKDDGTPNLRWDQIPVPAADDSETSDTSVALSDEEAIKQLNALIRTFIDSLDNIRDPLLFRANRGETATQTLKNMLDRLQVLTREVDADNGHQEHDMYVAYAPFIEEVALLTLNCRLLGAKAVHMGAIGYFVEQYNEQQGISDSGE